MERERDAYDVQVESCNYSLLLTILNIIFCCLCCSLLYSLEAVCFQYAYCVSAKERFWKILREHMNTSKKAMLACIHGIGNRAKEARSIG